MVCQFFYRCSRRREHLAIGRKLRKDLYPISAAQVVDPARALGQLFLRVAPLPERVVDRRPICGVELGPFASARELPHVLVDRPQHVLNGDTDQRIARRLNGDDLWISLMAFQPYQWHGWVYGGGSQLFIREVIVVIDCLSGDIELEKVLF